MLAGVRLHDMALDGVSETDQDMERTYTNSR